ncbi:KptA family-domain-containing protein [Chaetomium sp. MPI-SDFR-AT-0129]|nr:KptA family-domain-containing protein [Chaetomium sp. MPI-SDFR-AT-0129]
MSSHDLDLDEDRLADLALSSTRQSGSRGGKRGGRGGGGRGRGGGGGGGGGRDKREVDLSRALSRLLRHQAANAGVPLDREGFASLERVLQWPPLRSLSPSFAEIRHAVDNSDKQRFALKPDPRTNPDLDESTTDPAHWLIRANQGHSIKLDSEHLLKPLALPLPGSATASAGGETGEEEGKETEGETGKEVGKEKEQSLPPGALPIPPTVIHGTYFAFWPSILASGGLKPMGRNHVHFSTGLPDPNSTDPNSKTVISGMRADAELLIYIDVERSLRDAESGIKWWMSENGVVLTEGNGEGIVPVKYFKEVVGRRQQVGVLWRDGEWVGDLPEGVKSIHHPKHTTHRP